MSGTLVGKNAQEARDLLVASAVVHAHTVLIGKPGCGKTAIARAVADAIYGDKQVFVRLNASTPPEKVEGVPSWEELQKGNYQLVVKGTPYDPIALAIIADEIGRPMDQIFEIFLDIMDRQDTDADKSPIVWGTSNFLPTSERTEAFRDRFTFRYWYEQEPINVAETCRNQLLSIGHRPSISNSLPTPQQLQDVYAAVPGEKAIAAITKLVERLVREAAQGLKSPDGSGGKKVTATFEAENYRRLNQWNTLLFRMGYFLTGDNDFGTVPAGAIKMLNWAYPTDSLDHQKKWQQVLQSVADPLEAALSTLRINAYRKFKEINDTNSDVRAKGLQLGKAVADTQSELWSAAEELTTEKDDRGRPLISDEAEEKVKAAVDELQRQYAKVLKGGNPLE